MFKVNIFSSNVIANAVCDYINLHKLNIYKFVCVFLGGFVVTIFDAISIAVIIPLLNIIANLQGVGFDGEGTPQIFQMFGDWLDTVGIPRSPGAYIGLIISAMLAKQFIYYFQRRALLRMMQDAGYSCRSYLFRRIVWAKIELFSSLTSGNIVNHLDRECYMSGTVIFSFVESARILLMACAYMAMLIAISPQMTFFTIATFVLITLSSQIQVKMASRFSNDLIYKNGKFRNTMNEYVAGVRTIKSFKRENLFSQRFEEEAADIAEVNFRHKMSYSLMRVAVEPVTLICLLVSMYVGFVVLEITFPIFVGFMGILVRLSMQSSDFNTARIDLMSNLQSFFAVRQMVERASVGSAQQSCAEKMTFTKISLHDVGYEFPGATNGIVEINMTLEVGQRIGIVGKSGSGKTTLVDVLSGMRVATTGDFFVDGKKMLPEEFARIQENAAVVGQDVFLFQGSIRDNVLFSDQETMPANYREVLESACVSEFVALEDEGDLRKLGLGGDGLSGGQKQRIAIARALVAKKKLLVFDEATSALDAQAENAIAETIRNLPNDVMVVIVSHRPKLLEGCDVIYNLTAGRIVDTYVSCQNKTAFEKANFIDR